MIELMYNWSDVAVATEPMRAIAAWVLPAIAGGVSAVINGISAAKSGEASKVSNMKAENQLATLKSNIDEWAETRLNENYLTTPEAQAAINKARELAENQMTEARGRQAVMGGTAASLSVAQNDANKLVADTMGNVAAVGTGRRSDLERAYLNQKNDIATKLNNWYAGRASQNAAAGAQAMNNIGNIASSLITSMGGSGA